MTDHRNADRAADKVVHANFPFSCRVAAAIAWDRTWKVALESGHDAEEAQRMALVTVLLTVEKAARNEEDWKPGEADAKSLVAEIWPFTFLDAIDAREAITEYVCMREGEGEHDAALLGRSFAEIARRIVAKDGERAFVDELRSWPYAWTKLLPA